MRRVLLVSAVVLLMIGSLGAGYFVARDNQPAVTSTQSPSVCDTPYSLSSVKGTMSNSSYLFFDTNSTAWLCVVIYNDNNGTVSDNGPPPDVWAYRQGAWSYPSPNLNVTTRPSTFVLPPDSVSWYMLEITPVNMSQTIYMVPLPNVCWGTVYIAVGYSTTYLQSTLVNLPEVASSCPPAHGLAMDQGFTNVVPVYSK